jgi:uncharacterized protein (TIGR04255 family)
LNEESSVGRELASKPLVEAILEARWALSAGQSPGLEIDPHYRLVLGRMFDRLQTEYPVHEDLPTSMVPDALVAHAVQHRFRRDVEAWPLVQLGPGILTVNDTEAYRWSDFRSRSSAALAALYDAHPRPQELRLDRLMLRYIDAVPIADGDDVLAFLREKLKVSVTLPTELFSAGTVQPAPAHAILHASFACGSPKGTVTLRFSTGQHRGARAVIWETIFESVGAELPELPARFAQWLDGAHDLVDDWFFALIAGELEARFSRA